jgi:hypothetical protein
MASVLDHTAHETKQEEHPDKKGVFTWDKTTPRIYITDEDKVNDLRVPLCSFVFTEPYPCSDAFFLQIQSKSSNDDKITQRFNTFSPAAKPHQKKCNHSRMPLCNFVPGTLSVFWCLLSPDPEQSKQKRQNNTKIDTFSPAAKTPQKKCNHSRMSLCSFVPGTLSVFFAAFFLQIQSNERNENIIASPKGKKEKRIGITEHELKLDHVPAEWGEEESMRHE